MAPSPFGHHLGTLTLTTLLLMQMLLLPLGMVVMRMGVLLSPRVSSAKEATGTRGLLQPGRLSPALMAGERLRPLPGCLPAVCILPRQQGAELWCTERALGTADKCGSSCRRGEPGPPYHPSTP